MTSIQADAPTNLSYTAVTLNATINNWNPTGGNEIYDIRITTPSFIMGTLNSNPPSSTFSFNQSFTSLLANTQYTYAIRLQDPPNPSQQSSGHTFTTLAPSIPAYPPPNESNIDISGCESKAEVDVAELYLKMQSPTIEDEDTHVINIVTKQALDIGQFKELFYARGDEFFSIANCYENPKSAVNISKSVWGIPAKDPSSLDLFQYNYNKLGGRNNNPPATFLAYTYENNRQRTFYAQEEIMGNIERDICAGRKTWSICSRAGIFDSLYNLSFAREKYSSPCLKISCARTWDEVEDALSEYCLCKNISLAIGDYIDFFINVKIVNENCCVKPSIIRIRFIVQITDGWADMTNWEALSLFYNPLSSVVPMGNTQTLFTQGARLLFFGTWKERKSIVAITPPMDASGVFTLTRNGNTDVLFNDPTFNWFYASGTSVNGEILTDSNWPNLYFDVSHNYLFERSINGYPNNYMIASYRSGSMDPNEGYAKINFDWIQGVGDYEIVADPSYSLNIYDLSHNCPILSGIQYDSPEGGTFQYSGASSIEIDGSMSNQKRVQAPNTTLPANLDTMIDPEDS